MARRKRRLVGTEMCARCEKAPRTASRVYCGPCSTILWREWRAKNQERYNEYSRMRWAASPEERERLLQEYRRKYPSGARARASSNPHSLKERRAYQLKKNYGITVEQYDEMLVRQGGGCAICGSTESGDIRRPVLHIDHCHETGVIRGLLCMACNNGLGLFSDSPARLQSAAAYLSGSA